MAGLRRSYRSFNAALSSLYADDLLRLADDADKPDFDDAAFLDAADMVYHAGKFDASMLNTPEAHRLIAETLKQIKRGIDSGIPHEVPEVVKYALENNAFIFSGFKAYHTLREVGVSLVTDEGDIKPFDAFKKDVEAINGRYNHNYLYAEYNHAVGASLMASRWQQFEQDGDRYDLQYRTAEDDRVREDHAILHGTTLPPSDPFWSLYLPPNGWNCRCTAVQVRKGKYPQSDPVLAMQRGNNCTENAKQQIFRFNPGKTLQLFPPKHPYYKAPEDAKQTIKKVIKEEQEKQHRQQLYDLLPVNMNKETREAIVANTMELEKELKVVCGKPMTISEADRQSANPLWKPKYIEDPNGRYCDSEGNRYIKNTKYRRAYHINCQTCTPAYVLRLRGLDIAAKGNTRGSKSEYLSRHPWECWKNADGTQAMHTEMCTWLKNKKYKSMTPEHYEEFFEETTKEEGVYGLCLSWKKGGGHMTILQRLHDGTLVYVEPQHFDDTIGEQRPITELCDECKANTTDMRDGVMRLDDKIFNTEFAQIFRKTKK